MKNYIIIGDSITYGIGDSETGGYASMFKKYIVDKDTSIVCSNFVQIAGFPGATSKDILSRIDNLLDGLKDDEFDNVVILSIGVNDSKYFNGDFYVSKENYKENMKELIKKITDMGCELILLGLTRIELDELEFKEGKFFSNVNIEDYEKDLRIILDNDDELKELSKDNGIKYIEMKDVLSKDDYIDGLHPNTKGHRKMFERIKDSLGV